MEKATNGTTLKIERWVDFDNHPAGEATAAAIKGRCTDCWGRLVGQLNGNGSWTSIECQICGRSVKGEEADREMKRMCREVVDNLPKMRRGLPANYRKDAKFVLKILPDMDRNKAYFDKRTAAIFAGHTVRGLPLQLQQRARAKLLAIDAANRLNDLLTPPGNRLEALRADRRGQYSIRVNDRWRICFVWRDGESREVEIVDYH